MDGGPPGNLLPGDDETTNMTLENTGTGASTVDFTLDDTGSVETGTCGASESGVDPDCNVAGAPGELDSAMTASIYWYDPDTGTRDYIVGSSSSKVSVASMTLGTNPTTLTIPAGETRHLIVDWELRFSTGNEIKTDTLTFDGTVTTA
jgi:hypothetical protein